MQGYLRILSCLLCLVVLTASEVCNATNMNYVSRFTLGKQDELNRTFTKIQQKIATLDNLVYKTPIGAEYQITDIILNYIYRDSKQKAEFRGQDVIIISGGLLQVQCSFKWSRSFFTVASGSAVAVGLTDEITFAKKLVIDGMAYSYELLSSIPLVLDKNGLSFTRIDPPDVVESDKNVLLQMMNGIDGFKDLKATLLGQMQKIFQYYLNASLHDEHFPIENQFDYRWMPGKDKKNMTISFIRRPVTVDVQKIGLISSSELQVEKANRWQCGGRRVPDMPLDQKLFGGIQEYTSFDLYDNVLKWAISDGLLDSHLTRENWGNRLFEFYAGDLYEVFPVIQSSYYANEVLDGECEANSIAFNIVKHDSDSFNVTMGFSCILSIKADKIMDFNIVLTTTIAGIPGKDYLDFTIRSFDYRVGFFPIGKYQLADKNLAVLMVGDCLKRLHEARVFGSGWPQSPPRDYPHFKVYDNYTAIFDSSMVSSSLQQ